jgi:hypothetical protein
MSRVRRFLARAVFLGIGATQGGCCCLDEPTATKAVVEIDRPDPAVAALIARCTTVKDCDPICNAALEKLLEADSNDWSVSECEVTPTATGATIELAYGSNVACGRAPVGLVADRAHLVANRTGLVASRADLATDHAARWLAHAAYLEAASVVAFVHLAADLARLGAPPSLVARALVAADDEVRHARMLRAIAGGDVRTVRTLPYRPQTLFALARHNAVEGCVRETIGAAINVCQARSSSNPTLRALFAQIAADEIRHAELAWEVDAWARTGLSAAEQHTLDAARDEALRSVRAIELPDDPRLGMPSRAQLAALIDELVCTTTSTLV